MEPVQILLVEDNPADVCLTFTSPPTGSKPLEFDRFVTSVESLRDFWLCAATLPPR